jgi:glutamine cyclotransferase
MFVRNSGHAVRKFVNISFSLLVLLSGCTEDAAELDSPAKKPDVIKWNGANSGQTFTIGEKVPIRFSSADNTVLSGPVEVFINDSLFGKAEPGQTFEREMPTDHLRLGEHLIKVIAPATDGKKVVKNFIFEIYSDIVPVDYEFDMLEKLPHNRESYTQGLEFYKGRLFEGTGLAGHSRLMEIDLATGNERKGVKLADQYFGEGITVLNDKIYQITYQSQVCFVYDVNTLEKVNEFRYEMKEGWGLCNNGSQLIMSDGSNTVYFINPDDFSVVRTINVYNNEGDIAYLNELELINDTLYANVYQYDLIVQIDPKNGKVLGHIFMDKIKNEFEFGLDMDVLNGIAYRADKEGFYVTGKKWPHLFRIRLKKKDLPP